MLSEISADFVLGSISNKLAVQIQDVQKLIVLEQEKAEEQKALEQVPASVTVTETPDGGKNVVIEASLNVGIEAGLSGEIIKTYSLQIVDLVAAKNVYDWWKNYVDTVLETEIVFMLILSAVFHVDAHARYLRFLNSFSPSISVTYSKPFSIRALAAKLPHNMVEEGIRG